MKILYWICLHSPKGEKIYFNVSHITKVGETTLNKANSYVSSVDGTKFVKETTSEIMKLLGDLWQE
ncbi:hypothetical protein [Actinobacillus equuli]|uniref:Uncharacterized protein n=1 Tax=Actinobacillus equuli TaxID=718 RepID=A0AAX3FL98_ACTEU|nr:hypothetical protein [Actinobacillus equuli]AIZ78735.1 hypothetical protein ACEE_02865 [Actinobacillus equuli subsp. equuli]WGE44993.1 hypothetical protein NYR65_02840 [Actinobacillus equuli subsp. equuli]VEE92952.1 Uncharacterised protein [Actinobacillus equuli]